VSALPALVDVRCRRCGSCARFTVATETVDCSACVARYRHPLDWPADAFYQTDSSVGLIWTYNRDHALRLRVYIASTARSQVVVDDVFARYLRQLSPACKQAKRRDEVCKRLDRLLRS